MIPDRWHAVINSRGVPRGRPVSVLRMGEGLVFWRCKTEQAVRPRDICLDRGVAVGGGKNIGLDIMPLPYVRCNTIGRGERTVVDRPLVTIKDETIRYWVCNRRDEGLPVRCTEELQRPPRAPFLHLRFPNIWKNNISPDLRIGAVIAPIDERRTVLYPRVYRWIVRLPPLREIFHGLALIGCGYMARQDRTVAETRQPRRTDLPLGEHPVPGDGPVILDRHHRPALLDAAGIPEAP
jgi:phenylpropionate dioxygenase-like ring-hydroxylating dioxygenase large terminal subunit